MGIDPVWAGFPLLPIHPRSQNYKKLARISSTSVVDLADFVKANWIEPRGRLQQCCRQVFKESTQREVRFRRNKLHSTREQYSRHVKVRPGCESIRSVTPRHARLLRISREQRQLGW